MEGEHFYDEEDLVTANANERNWKGIIIAVFVISTILALIVTSVVLLTPPDSGPRVKGKRFELDDIFGFDFQPRTANGTWISGSEWIFTDTSGGVSVIDVSTLSIRPLLRNQTFRRLNTNGLSGYSLSADLRFALLSYNVQRSHRYSFKAKYVIYEIQTEEAFPLNIQDREEGIFIQIAQWAPVGNSLVFVHDGDIYYKKSAKEKLPVRITYTGVPNLIHNGIPDWLYEEEILESNSALWWSQNGEYILFLTFNDTLVGEHFLFNYGSVDNPLIYPEVISTRYPKPGTTNPTVVVKAVRVSDLRYERNPKPEGIRIKELSPPTVIQNHDHYISAGGWINSDEVGIVWINRAYNLSIISICSVEAANCQEVYRVSSEGRGWLENLPFPTFSTRDDTKNFITIAPVRDGENGFFDHLVYVDVVNERSHPITHGSYDVLKVCAWDELGNLVYYIGHPDHHPGERHLYRLKLEHPYSGAIPECLTCNRNMTSPISFNSSSSDDEFEEREKEKEDKKKADKVKENMGDKEKTFVVTEKKKKVITNLTGTSLAENTTDDDLMESNRSCSFVTSVKFSLDKSYFIVDCGGPNIPFVAVYEPQATKARLITILQNNDEIHDLSKNMAWPQVRNFAVRLMHGHTAYVRLLLPPGLKEDEITKYPLVLNVYGGPGSQLALHRWGVDFTTYLSSKKGYIVAQVDSRGSGGRGWDFQHKVYYKLGLLETQDQIEVIRYLKNSLHFISERNVGAYGWSYGGYLTSMLIASKESTGLFHCGASIAPVTSWRLYDSAYSEKYMGLPNVTDNYKGYEDSDVTRNLENFQDKMFYLIHGTADDNVHIQHSMILAKALIAKRILFRQQIYPDEQHHLSGVKYHVHKSLEGFFEDCFKKQAPPELGTGLNKGGKFDDFD